MDPQLGPGGVGGATAGLTAGSDHFTESPSAAFLRAAKRAADAGVDVMSVIGSIGAGGLELPVQERSPRWSTAVAAADYLGDGGGEPPGLSLPGRFRPATGGGGADGEGGLAAASPINAVPRGSRAPSINAAAAVLSMVTGAARRSTIALGSRRWVWGESSM